MFSSWILAQAAQPEGPSLITSLIPMVLIFFIFWFFLFRPQAKQHAAKKQEHESFLGALKVGDEVVTTGGIFGRVTGIEDHVIQLEISRGTKIRVLRPQIQAPPLNTLATGDKDESDSGKSDDKDDEDKNDTESKKDGKKGKKGKKSW